MRAKKLISWNVNGIRASQKKGLIEWVEKESPDVLCLQETKASPEQLSPELINIKGYTSYFSSAEKKGYSGVAVYTKEPAVKVKTGFGIKKFDSEGRMIAADLGKFVLLNIYFPNGKASPERLAYKMEFYEEFLKYADSLTRSGRDLVVCGDVNTAHKPIDLARPKENESVSGFLPEERAFLDKLVAHGYSDTLRMFDPSPGLYTWWDLKSGARSRNVGWRIDYFFVNDAFKDKVRSAFILKDVQGSDHCPIGIVLES